MVRVDPDVIYSVQAIENRGPEGTFVHLVLEHPSGTNVVEIPIEELDLWQISLN